MASYLGFKTGNPLKVSIAQRNEQAPNTRSGGSVRLVEAGKSNLSSKTFINDATRIWNRAPQSVKDCVTISAAKIGQSMGCHHII